MITKEEYQKDLEYLDKEFPKGKTKFRGQAMVLLALAREQGEAEERKDFEEKIDKKLIGLSDYHIEERHNEYLGNFNVLITKDKSEFESIAHLNSYKKALKELKQKLQEEN